MTVGRLAILAASAVVSAALAATDLGPVKERAVRSYDRGSYDEARKTLVELDLAGALDGPLLYRLFFCEKAAGRTAEARKALDRARAALEKEIASSSSLEVAFYLANTYANLGRAADAMEAARSMTAKVESGVVAPPTSGIGLFQLGKLYEDQSRQNEATAFYTKAVNAFDLTDGRYSGSAAWALRYLGNVAFARADFAASESAFARLTALGGVGAQDWDTLAAARARLYKYGEAAEAWRTSVTLDPANADDARYAARLADTAALLAPIPVEAPDGGTFTTMDQAALKAYLRSRAEAATAAQARAAEAMGPDKDGVPTHPLDAKLREEISEALRDARRHFVAAGLEFAIRGYGIRDTAFGEGYAVHIFQDRAWELPSDPEAPADVPAKSGS